MTSKAYSDWPEVNSQEVFENKAIVRYYINDNLRYFAGHFPDQAVLPGIVQIHWAEHYGRTLLGMKGMFSELKGIKFQRPVFPNVELTLHLAYDESLKRLSFSYESHNGGVSSGRICLR